MMVYVIMVPHEEIGKLTFILCILHIFQSGYRASHPIAFC
jgi:hypothetical protein